MNRAVKAIFYRSDNCIFLQQRDYKKQLKYPGHWNLFGGKVKKNENIKDALKRELIEEINFELALMPDPIFEWVYHGKNYKTINSFFPLKLNGEDKNFELKEGRSMKWFGIKELRKIKLTPAVSENIINICNSLDLRI